MPFEMPFAKTKLKCPFWSKRGLCGDGVRIGNSELDVGWTSFKTNRSYTTYGIEPAHIAVHQRASAGARVDDQADLQDHVQDLRQGALVEDQHLLVRGDELRGQLRLDVREADHEIGLQRTDLVHAPTDEGADDGLGLPRLRRSQRVGADAHEPVRRAQRIEDLGRLLGEADDPLWAPGQTRPRGAPPGDPAGSRPAPGASP